MEEIRLPSGNTIHVPFDLVGINEELEIYDGLGRSIEESLTFRGKPSPMIGSDAAFLADLMIDRWERYKDKHLQLG